MIPPTDYDRDVDNYELTFSLSDTTFDLTSPTLTSTWPPTYTTQLVLIKNLTQPREYRLTVTATVSEILCPCIALAWYCVGVCTV